MNRAVELLNACKDLLQKQNETIYVLNMLETTVFYDGVECDGSCLLEDIEIYLEETEEKLVEECKPHTNADRIRSMSDEELAEFLLKVNTANEQPCMIDGGDCKWEDYPTRDKGCKDCFLEYLRKEVKGSDV